MINHVPQYTEIKSIGIKLGDFNSTELVVNPTDDFVVKRFEKTLIFNVPIGQRLIGLHGLYRVMPNSSYK